MQISGWRTWWAEQEVRSGLGTGERKVAGPRSPCADSGRPERLGRG